MADKGDKAPDFAIETAEGTKRLADFAGRKLVVYFYPKDDTSGCTKEAVAFTALADAFRAADTHILGISRDSLASHEKFAAKHDLGILLGSDPDNRMIEAFGSWVEKSMYGRKYMGIDRSTFLIDREGRIAEAWRKVKVPGHAEAVLKAAEALA
ncbi:MAG: peroxiredoxin [Thermaurantiacus sp.]